MTNHHPRMLRWNKTKEPVVMFPGIIFNTYPDCWLAVVSERTVGYIWAKLLNRASYSQLILCQQDTLYSDAFAIELFSFRIFGKLHVRMMRTYLLNRFLWKWESFPKRWLRRLKKRWRTSFKTSFGSWSSFGYAFHVMVMVMVMVKKKEKPLLEACRASSMIFLLLDHFHG